LVRKPRSCANQRALGYAFGDRLANGRGDAASFRQHRAHEPRVGGTFAIDRASAERE